MRLPSGPHRLHRGWLSVSAVRQQARPTPTIPPTRARLGMLPGRLTRPCPPGTVVGMKRRSWKVWVTGISLAQLFVLGADVAMWPQPSEAERMAARLYIGMTEELALEILRDCHGIHGKSSTCRGGYFCWFQDGSRLSLGFECRVSLGQSYHVTTVRTDPPDPSPPLTRLRRTLARLMPVFGE
jgi:hypothetical protein